MATSPIGCCYVDTLGSTTPIVFCYVDSLRSTTPIGCCYMDSLGSTTPIGCCYVESLGSTTKTCESVENSREGAKISVADPDLASSGYFRCIKFSDQFFLKFKFRSDFFWRGGEEPDPANLNPDPQLWQKQRNAPQLAAALHAFTRRWKQVWRFINSITIKSMGNFPDR